MAFEDGDTGGQGEGQSGAGGAADLLGGASTPSGGQGGAGGEGAGGEGVGGDGSGGSDGGTEPDWYQQVSAEAGEGESASLRDWLKSAGIKDLDGLAKVARDNQRALRDGGRVKVPGEGASAEEIAAYRKAIGVPDDAKGYEFKAPVGEDGNPIELNNGTLSRIAELAHKHSLPKGPIEALVSDYVQGELDDLAAAQRDLDTQAQSWLKQQGNEAPAKIAAVDRAATALGISGKEMQALRAAWGPERALTLMARLGEGMAEDSLIGGGAAKFGITGAQAQAEIDRLTNDREFMAKVRIPGSAEAARWKRLNDAAGEAANRAAANA